MMTTEALYLGLLFSGIVALLTGLGLTRAYWHPDLPPYGCFTRFLDVTLHPEKYAKDAPLRLIRSLNSAGALLLLAAATVAVCEILRTMHIL